MKLANAFKIGMIMVAMFTVGVMRGQTVSSDSILNLDLRQALEIALSESPIVKIADSEIQKQEYAKKGVLANLMPQLDFSFNYNRTIKKQVMYLGSMGGEQTDGPKKGIPVGLNNSWSTGFQANLPIISAPLWKQLSISADEVELAIEKSRSSKLTLTKNVKQAFYSVLLAEDSYSVFKETYDNAVDNYNDIKQKFDQGLVSEYDLIRADVSVKNIEPNMYDAQNSIILSKWRLKALIGIDLDMNINCVGALKEYEDKLYAEYMSVDTTMLAGNSTLRQLDVQSRQLKKSNQMAKAAYYPSLNLGLSYRWNAMNDDFKFKNYTWDPYSVLSVSLNIPIFSGGKRYSSVKQSKVQMQQLELSRIDTERGLMVTVRQSMDKMKTSIKQFSAASEGEKQARKGYDIAVKRYDTGAGTILEINDSRLALTQSQLNKSQAVYGFLVAQADLDETLGNDNK